MKLALYDDSIVFMWTVLFGVLATVEEVSLAKAPTAGARSAAQRWQMWQRTRHYDRQARINRNSNQREYFGDIPVPEVVSNFLTDEDFERADVLEQTGVLEMVGHITNQDAEYRGDLFQGDIATTGLSVANVDTFIQGGPIFSALSRHRGVLHTAVGSRLLLWDDAQVPYSISTDYSREARSILAAAFNEFERQTCIRFVPKSSRHTDYLHVFPEQGCWSKIGKQGGLQELSIGEGCLSKGIIVHELMHTLGFLHEQSRPDRDEYVTINWYNVIPGMEDQFYRFRVNEVATLGTSYDYGSIMHYGPFAFSKNYRPTVQPKPANMVIGQREKMSAMDVHRLNKLYRCYEKEEAANVQNVTQPATQLSHRANIRAPPSPAAATSCIDVDRRGVCSVYRRQGFCTADRLGLVGKYMRRYCARTCGFCL